MTSRSSLSARASHPGYASDIPHMLCDVRGYMGGGRILYEQQPGTKVLLTSSNVLSFTSSPYSSFAFDMPVNSTTHEFPSPIGGVPFQVDFFPSILFACLYALLVPVVLWRIIHPRSRNGVLIGTTLFSIERYVPRTNHILHGQY